MSNCLDCLTGDEADNNDPSSESTERGLELNLSLSKFPWLRRIIRALRESIFCLGLMPAGMQALFQNVNSLNQIKYCDCIERGFFYTYYEGTSDDCDFLKAGETLKLKHCASAGLDLGTSGFCRASD